ncbi:MAG TPA: hypothetical protein PK129_04250, partial [Cellvibrionaceae bacterium]|nr:hypothetical protein [Cellvibrionaceae bacterium]
MSANPHRPLFLTISSLLTGFSEVELLGTGMCDTYLKTLHEENNPATLEYFFVACAEVLRLGEGDKEKLNNLIAQRLMPDSCYDSLAKILFLCCLWGNGRPGLTKRLTSPRRANSALMPMCKGWCGNLPTPI